MRAKCESLLQVRPLSTFDPCLGRRSIDVSILPALLSEPYKQILLSIIPSCFSRYHLFWVFHLDELSLSAPRNSLSLSVQASSTHLDTIFASPIIFISTQGPRC